MPDAGLRLPSLVVPVLLLAGATLLHSQDVPPGRVASSRHTLNEYFALGEQARKGDVEAAVAELRTFEWRTFRDFRDELAKLRPQLERAPHRILEKWDRTDIEALAMLHTEAAIRSEPFSAEEASHGNWARQLLELFEGMNVDQTFRQRWHLTWGAHLQSYLGLRELAEHLHHALRKWPEDPDLLTMAGSVYESWSHRVVTAHLGPDYIPLRSRLERQQPELRRSRALAEEYYQRALAVQARLFHPHLRLGRMAMESNQLDRALAHVERAVESASSARERYLAQLVRGSVYTAAQRWSDALAAYEEADRILPTCQAPALASSYVLLKRGARDGARAQVKMVLERATAKACDDPWWEYEFGYGPRAEALLQELRDRLRR